MTRLSILNVGRNLCSGATTYPIDTPANIGVDQGAGSLDNSIVRNAQKEATDTAYTGDYLDYYNSGTSVLSPTHTYATDPYANGLLYPVRVESGSTLANAVSGGIGANIQYRLGADGLEYSVLPANLRSF